MGFRLAADSPAALFRLAAEGLRRALGHEAAGAAPEEEEEEVHLERPDTERLLVAWLRMLLEEGERRGAVPEPLTVTVDPAVGGAGAARLDARLAWRGRSQAPVREVKGVTYHGLQVRERDGRWEAAVVLDV